jgi:hypothetical protein
VVAPLVEALRERSSRSKKFLFGQTLDPGVPCSKNLRKHESPSGSGICLYPLPCSAMEHPQIFSQVIVPMSKHRGFSIVLHDVHKGLQTKADVQAKVQLCQWRQYVIAEEPYNHQEGSHIHLFLQLKNPVYFTAVLKTWCTWWKSGRVQVDAMKGSMVQACKYLMEGQSKKDSKEFDPKPIIMLDQMDAEEVGVDAQVITYGDLLEGRYKCLQECGSRFECFMGHDECLLQAYRQYVRCGRPK